MLGGCTKDQDYLDVLSEQQAAWNDVADVLETIKDEKSMAAARTALEERAEKFDAVVKKAQALPPPGPETLKKMEQRAFLLQRAIERAQEEVRRVRALPGGEAFWRQFGAKYQGLAPAVQP
jgi:hypothetical protein